MKTKLDVANWQEENGFVVNAERVSGLKRFSAVCLKKIQSLKEKLSIELGFRFSDVRPEIFRQALNEAAALATSTPFPSLFLPALAEEKVLKAWEWERRQRAIQERSWRHAA